MNTAPHTRTPSLRRLAPLLLVLGLLVSIVTACDRGGSVDISLGDDGGSAQVETADFFVGLWDGLISPFTGVASLFNDVEIYDDDGGEAYPLGFGLGLILIVMFLLGVIVGPRYYRSRR